MSVQLAPQHKVGLALHRPLLVANCTVELLGLLDREVLGAVVAPELGGRARRPRPVVERPGGFLLAEGRGVLSLSGLRHLVRAAGDLPVIARVRAGAAGAVDRRVLERLADEGVSAIELDLPPGDAGSAMRSVAAARAASDLPLLARLPLLEAVPYALACAEAGADALVVAAPPRGLAVFEDPTQPRPVEVHGPLLHPLNLLALQQVAEVVDLPLVARGGILTVDDARAYLSQGAVAVAVNSLALVAPSAVTETGRRLGL